MIKNARLDLSKMYIFIKAYLMKIVIFLIYLHFLVNSFRNIWDTQTQKNLITFTQLKQYISLILQLQNVQKKICAIVSQKITVFYFAKTLSTKTDYLLSNLLCCKHVQPVYPILRLFIFCNFHYSLWWIWLNKKSLKDLSPFLNSNVTFSLQYHD